MELKMPVNPEWLRASVLGKPMGVDREAAVIRGAILSEEGPFKDGRGEFDRQAIRKTVKLANEKTGGLKSRFTHPTATSDSLGKHLGRITNVRSDTVLREVGRDTDGKPLMKERLVARGDLKLDPTSLQEPPGGGKPLGEYVMDLAESDPEALGLSLVLKPEQTTRLDNRNRPLTDDKGQPLPPLWMPVELHACDCVSEGDATNSFLSADILAGLPDAIVRQGCQLLDAQFAGQLREVVEARCSAFLNRYLAYRFPEAAEDLEAEPAAEGDTPAPAVPSEPADADLAAMLDLCIAEAG